VRKLGLVLCLAGASVFATAAAAMTPPIADSAAAAAPAAPASAGTSDPNKIVCKSMPAPTGTRIGSQRQCMTQAQWDQKEQQDQQALMHNQSQGYQTHTGNGN